MPVSKKQNANSHIPKKRKKLRKTLIVTHGLCWGPLLESAAFMSKENNIYAHSYSNALQKTNDQNNVIVTNCPTSRAGFGQLINNAQSK
jgi:hypothetical protein